MSFDIRLFTLLCLCITCSTHTYNHSTPISLPFLLSSLLPLFVYFLVRLTDYLPIRFHHQAGHSVATAIRLQNIYEDDANNIKGSIVWTTRTCTLLLVKMLWPKFIMCWCSIHRCYIWKCFDKQSLWHCVKKERKQHFLNMAHLMVRQLSPWIQPVR